MASTLWKNLDKLVDEIVPPKKVLTNFVSELNEVAQDYITAELVLDDSERPNLDWHFRIRVPLLDDYRVLILSVTHHGANLYPAWVHSHWVDNNNKREECADKDSLRRAVEARLASDAIQRVVASLIAQAKDRSDEIPF